MSAFNGIDLLFVNAFVLAILWAILWGMDKGKHGCYRNLQQTSHTDEVYDWERDGL